MPNTKVCVVIGGTQGIGCHIVKQIGTISISLRKTSIKTSA